VGSAYSANAAGVLVPLEQSTSLNLRAAYQLTLGPGTAELFLRVDNVTDEFIEPQIGLPAPGRWFRGGVRFAW
jgi:iron complex outermembrane recepter protein